MASIWSEIYQKLINAIGFKGTAEKEGTHPPPVLRAELQIPPSVIDQYNTAQRKNNTRECVRLIIDGLTVVVGVAGFVVLYQTLSVTWEAVDAARREARASEEAARTARDQLQLSEQPWVGPSRGQVSNVEVDKAPTITTFWTNFGDTPAFEVEHQTVMGLAQSDAPTDKLVAYVTNEIPVKQLGTIFPSQVLMSSFTYNAPLTPAEVEDIAAGKKELHVFGVIRYKDRFGKLHHTWIYQPYDPKLKQVVHLSRPGMPPSD